MAESEGNGSNRHDVETDRKRRSPLDDGPEAKRSNLSHKEEQVIVLIPISVIGSVIGNGGEEIRALQSESKCRIDISKGRESFQDTNERACVVKGEISGLILVMKTILEKIQEKINPGVPRDYFDLKDFARKHEMKLVIPHVSAGPIIGQNGSNINEIRESTNVHIVVSSAKTPRRQTTERVITFGANQNDAILNAMQQIIEKFSTDTYYERESKKLADALRHPRPNTSPNQRTGGSFRSSGVFNFVDSNSTRRNGNFSNGGGSAPMVDGNMVNSLLGNLHNTLRDSGFSQMSVERTMDAMEELARYNTLGVVLNFGAEAMAQLNNIVPRSTTPYGRPPNENQPTRPHRYQPRMVPDTTVISDFIGTADIRDRYEY